jgi:WD40 repeat protein
MRFHMIIVSSLVAVALPAVVVALVGEKKPSSAKRVVATVYTVAFSPDGKTLASGSFDRTIKLWDMKSRTVVGTLRGRAGPVRSVAFSPNGAALASACEYHKIKLWNVKTRTESATLRRREKINWPIVS